MGETNRRARENARWQAREMAEAMKESGGLTYFAQKDLYDYCDKYNIFCAVEEVIPEVFVVCIEDDMYVVGTVTDSEMETYAALMDDEIRENIHEAMAQCTNAEFLVEYMTEHYDKYGEEFAI